VLDIPGAHGKVPIGPEYLSAKAQGYTVSDPQGQSHAYEDCCAGPR
jgi:lysine 2,3-aminomutase